VAIGVYKLLHFLLLGGTLRVVIAPVAALLNALPINDLLDTILNGLLVPILKLLGLNTLLNVAISFKGDPNSFYTLDDVPKFADLQMDKLLYYLSVGLASLLVNILNGLLGTPQKDCGLGGLINNTSGQLSGGINALLNSPLLANLLLGLSGILG
jgi:hypothetical protein